MAQPYYKTSKLTGDTYNLFDCVVIMNPKQAAFYCANGCKLEELDLSEDRKTGEPVFCYIFLRDSSKKVYDAWCKRKEEKHI